jgi:hypothetical protein
MFSNEVDGLPLFARKLDVVGFTFYNTVSVHVGEGTSSEIM